MKKILSTLVFSISLINCFSVELNFEIHGKYKHPVKKEQLQQAIFIKDFIPGFPVNWITDYISVEIRATCKGKQIKAINKTDVLTTEQKAILNNADFSTDVEVHVDYYYVNAESRQKEKREINTSVTVIPEAEAEYIGGLQQLKKYLREKAISKIPENENSNSLLAILYFTISENGEVTNATISKTSDDPYTDQLLLDAIKNMQHWKPARNGEGISVRQEFELRVGNGGC